jgi:hypothetical protein
VIVLRSGDRLRLIRQVDHQTQCGALARAWGNARFFRPDPYDPLIDVAECHDEGWRGQDEIPALDDHGEPVNFPDLDRAVHAPMYELGIAEAQVRGARVGLLASMHGQGLYEKRMGLDGPPPERDGRPAYELAFLRDQERLQAEMRAHLGGDPELGVWAWDCYRILQAWDVLSLYVCWHGLSNGLTWALPQVPRTAGDIGTSLTVTSRDAHTCVVDPWPFADPRVDLSIACRFLPAGPYASAAELGQALQNADDEQLELVAVPV